MIKRLSKFLSSTIAIMIMTVLAFLTNANGSMDQCKVLLDFVYKELTLNTLDLSYQRAMNKMLLGLHKVHNNTKNVKDYKKPLAKIINTLRKIDPKLKEKLRNNESTKRHFWPFSWETGTQLNPTEIQKVFKEWRNLQNNSPELFDGLEEKYKLDAWDSFTIDLIGNASKLNFSDSKLKEKIELLGKKLRTSSTNVLDGKNFDENSLKNSVADTQKELLEAFKKNAEDILFDYRNICSKKTLQKYLSVHNAFCPLPENDLSLTQLNKELKDLQELINDTGLLELDSPTVRITENPNIDINILKYRVNTSIKSEYCKRKPELISLIAIHHTALAKDLSPLNINDFHIDHRGSKNDPWYMIGYNYIISESLDGVTLASPMVFQGRQPEIQGAHTGGVKKYPVQLSKEQKSYMKGEVVSCGNEKIGFKDQNILEKAKRDGGVTGNMIAYGISISGNYNYTEKKIGNTKVTNEVDPDAPTIVSDSVITATAKLACNLQNKNPRIKTIVPHSYFKPSKCPGTIIESLEKIASEASKLGCKFSVKLTKDKKK